MSEEGFEIGPFDPSPGEDKKRLMRILPLVFIIWVFGIGASVGAVYFFTGAAGAGFFERARSSLTGLVMTRELPEDKFSQSSGFSSRNAKSDPQTGESQKRFGKVLINEIQIAGATADDEFIELFNPNDFSVDLTNWRIARRNASGKEYPLVSAAKLKGAVIPGRGYLLLGRDSGYAGAAKADILWAKSSGIAENNAIILFGKNEDGVVIVDKVGFGSAFDFEGAPAPNPEKGLSISRLSNSDTDNNAADFVLSEPSPRGPAIVTTGLSLLIPTKFSGVIPSPTLNSASSPGASPTASPTSVVSPASARQYGKVLISEVQIAGASANDEFVELFNPNDFSVDLTGWSIKRKSASGLEYSLVSAEKLKDKVVPARGYFLTANGGGYVGAVAADALWAQSNTIASDNTIILYGKRDDETLVVDKLGFGAASDYEGLAAQNPAAGQTLSRARETDTNNNRNDFILSAPSPRNLKSSSGFIAPTAASPPSPSPTSTPSPSPLQSPSPTPSPSPSPSPTPTPYPTPESSPSPTPEPSPNPTPSPSPSPSPSPTPTLTPSPSPSPTPSPTQTPASPAKILINEVQITGGPGQTTNDFIELYNPNSQPVNLKGYRLVKRAATSTSDTSIKSWTTDVFIPAFRYYLWANSNYTSIAAVPDAITTATIADNNGIAIRFGPGNTGTIIDSVGWGEAANAFVEGQAFPQNPAANQSIQRKTLGQDTDNNAEDFELNTSPTPQNSSS